MDKTTALWIAVIVSEIVALYLIRHIWRQPDYLAMKILMTVVALIPIVGTLGVLWTVGFPPVKPRALQNRNRHFPTTEVFDRWRGVLDEKDPVKQRRDARELIDQYRDDRREGKRKR